MQAYSDPTRANDPYSLPDVEVFWMGIEEAGQALEIPAAERDDSLAGWYWWSCLPGCLPEGEPKGPFATEEEALADVRSMD